MDFGAEYSENYISSLMDSLLNPSGWSLRKLHLLLLSGHQDPSHAPFFRKAYEQTHSVQTAPRKRLCSILVFSLEQGLLVVPGVSVMSLESRPALSTSLGEHGCPALTWGSERGQRAGRGWWKSPECLAKTLAGL